MDLVEKISKYLENCYRYLSIRNRSEKEIRDYLAEKKAEPEIIEAIVERLKKQKFLNDETFARSWVLQRARLRPRGKRLLQIELRQKGIADELIEQVLNEAHEEIPDEVTQAKRLIERRVKRLYDQPRQEIYNKVGAFLARRGYGWEVIKKAIDEVLNETI
ncbi:MAG: regulatory protein RecX [Candidatus Levyibacteriota bacterium]